jgi:hypothetical protein
MRQVIPVEPNEANPGIATGTEVEATTSELGEIHVEAAHE